MGEEGEAAYSQAQLGFAISSNCCPTSSDCPPPSLQAKLSSTIPVVTRTALHLQPFDFNGLPLPPGERCAWPAAGPLCVICSSPQHEVESTSSSGHHHAVAESASALEAACCGSCRGQILGPLLRHARGLQGGGVGDVHSYVLGMLPEIVAKRLSENT